MYNLKLVCGGNAKIEELPEGAVSLNGYVQGPVLGGTDELDRWSFDHHAGCYRNITLATCEQVWVALCGGFSFEDRDVYINQVDGDIIMCLWLINNPERCTQNIVRDLVRAVGSIDAHGRLGNKLLSLHERALANEFYKGALRPILSFKGRSTEHFDEWPKAIETCLKAVDILVDGGSLLSVLTDINEIDVVKTEKLQRCSVAMAGGRVSGGLDTLYAHGYTVGILYQEAANGNTKYTLAKESDWVSFNVTKAFERLASREPGWGGGSTIGGSPTEDGIASTLTPEEVWDIVVNQGK